MPNQPSANGTVVTANGGTISDALGNGWALYNGQVAVNGIVDSTTANVVELACVNGQIWQENAGHLWWGKSNPGGNWLPTYGTPVSPLFISSSPVSANDTVATVPGQTVTDANHHVWSLSAGGQVVTDGVTDTTTANVIELAYVNGQIWQENASHLWWAKSRPSDTWSPTYGTSASPLPAPPRVVSANNTIVGEFSSGTITDANGNVWSLVYSATAGEQVAVNGVVDPTTANVIALAYENGQIWQENADDLWWAKTDPGDVWSPTYGTSTSPVPTRTWVGGGDNSAASAANWSPAGAPQPGDTLQIGAGSTINVVGNDLAGNTLNVTGSTGPAVTINASDDAQINLSDLTFSSVALNVVDAVSLNAVSRFGMNASGGTIQFIGQSTLGHSSVFDSNLAGNGTVTLSGAQGEGAIAKVNGSVRQDLTFSLGGVAELLINHPDQFAGAVNFTSGLPLENLLLAELTATSGTLMNGVLSLFNADQLVDQVRVGGFTNLLTLDQTSAGVVLDENHINLIGGPSTGVIPLAMS